MGVKHYDKSFKEQAIKLSQQRGNINAVARELGVSSSQLSKWCSDMKTYKEQRYLAISKLGTISVEDIRH